MILPLMVTSMRVVLDPELPGRRSIPQAATFDRSRSPRSHSPASLACPVDCAAFRHIVPAVRAIATPCRAGRLPPPFATASVSASAPPEVGFLFGAGGSLGCALQITQHGGQVIAEAIRILESGAELSPSLPSAEPAPDGDQPRILCLAERLPMPSVDCDVQCVRLASADVAGLWPKLARPWPEFSLSFDCFQLRLHANTLSALRLAAPLSVMPSDRQLHIYTDGSEKEGQTGWAVVIMQWEAQRSNVAVLGAFGGRVVLDAGSCNFVGTSNQDARSAELTALIWGMLWLIAHWPAVCVVSATFHFDSVTAGFAACGRWDPGQDQLAHKARQLSQACEVCDAMCPVYWEHVKAHAGHPWNELADSAAEAMRLGTAPSVSQPCLSADANIGVMDISRLYLFVPTRDALAFPRISEGVANWSQDVTPLTTMRPEQIVPFACRANTQPWHLHFRCLTVNVQSVVGKHAYLEQQFEDKHIAIAFLQEMKEKGGLVRSQGYLRFATDADTHWGVAIWVSRTLPLGWASAMPVFADEASFNVISDGPRHLVLTVTVRGECFCLTSAHFPHQGRPEEERTSLQDEVDAAWGRASCSLVLMGCDANARVPTSYRQVTGDRSCGEPDPPGFCVCELAVQHGLCLPSTFSECHHGDDVTHVHPSGHASRIDYFAFSDCVFDGSVQTWVDRSIDLLTLQEDHFALVMDLRL